MTIEQDAPETDFTPEFEAADDARYQEFAEKHGGGAEDTSTDQVEAAPEPAEGDEAAEPVKPPERAPLTQAQIEERLNQTKAAMREERRKRRELESQLEEARRAAPPPAEDPFEAAIAALRDDEEDPLSDIAALKEVLRRYQASARAEREAEASRTTNQTAAQRHFAHVAEQEAEFREDTPDYDDAVTHFRTSLKAELEDQGLTGAELENEFGRSLVTLSQKALAAGKNPAEVVYALAKRRGYTPDPTPPPAPDLDKSKEKIQTLNRSQQAGRSLSSVGGRSEGGELTLSSVAKLDGKELLAGYAKLKAQAKRSGRYR